MGDMQGQVDASVATQFDIFQLYDRAVVGRFATFTWENKPIPIRMVSPQRAFASVARMFNAELYREQQALPTLQTLRLPLPNMGVFRGSVAPDGSRNFFRRSMLVGVDRHRLIALEAQSPTAVTVEYRLGFKAKTQEQMNEIERQFTNVFVLDNSFVDVEVPDWGRLCIGLKSTGLTSSVEEDPGDKERVFIGVGNLSLLGFSFREVRQVKLIGKVRSSWEVGYGEIPPV